MSGFVLQVFAKVRVLTTDLAGGVLHSSNLGHGALITLWESRALSNLPMGIKAENVYTGPAWALGRTHWHHASESGSQYLTLTVNSLCPQFFLALIWATNSIHVLDWDGYLTQATGFCNGACFSNGMHVDDLTSRGMALSSTAVTGKGMSAGLLVGAIAS